MFETALPIIYDGLSQFLRKDIAVMTIGPSGSGKTTLALSIQALFPSVMISADLIRKYLTGDELDQRFNPMVWNRVRQDIGFAHQVSQPVIIDATFAKKSDRLEMIQFLKPRYSVLVGIWVDTPLWECLERNIKRENPRPDHAIRLMYSYMWGDKERSFRRNLPSKGEGFAQFVRIYRTGHVEVS